MEGLISLVDYFCPALLVIGVAVRNCTWEGRDPNGGKLAREILGQCLCLLVHLFDDRQAKVEYVRTLSNRAISMSIFQSVRRLYLTHRCGMLITRRHIAV